MNIIEAIVLFLSILPLAFNRGFFSFPAIFALGILLLLLFILNFIPNKLEMTDKSSKELLVFIFFMTYILFIFFPGGIYMQANIFRILLIFIPLFILPIILVYVYRITIGSQQEIKKLFILLFIISIIMRFFIIYASPNPTIDVFTILKEAPLIFLKGENPYTAKYTQVYRGIPSDYYTYWPMSFILQVPFVLIFKDPRVLFVLCEIISAFIIYKLAKRNIRAQLLALIFLYRPNNNFLIEQSWLTPILFVLINIAVIYWIKEKYNSIVVGFVLGILVAVQPLFGVILPFFFYFSRRKFKLAISFILVLVLTVVPFFLWAPQAFVANTITRFLLPAQQIKNVPTDMALSVNTLTKLFTGSELPFWIAGLLLLAVILGIFCNFVLGGKIIEESSWRKRQISAGKIMLSLALFFLSFYFLNRFSFFNHYYFISNLLILWLAVKYSKNTI